MISKEHNVCLRRGELGLPAERTVFAVDPLNLIQIMLAEGKMSIRETRRQTKIIAIISVATALSYVKVFSLPQGGSVTASIVGASVGVFRRFCAHLLSGVVFFASYAPVGMSLIIYSVIYNGSNIIPELLVSVYLIYLLIKSGLIEAYK